jgi:hypothetical protein
MRALAFGLVSFGSLVGVAFGCGESDGDGGAGAAAGSATAGSSPSGAGTSSTAGGGAKAGSASGGSASAGASGSAAGGSAAGVDVGGSASGGQPDAQAGASNEGGSTAVLVDCDPQKIMCKRLAPVCETGEVPSVAGSCYGDCVKIDQCACSSADQCPQPNEYTCWGKRHCGPFVE